MSATIDGVELTIEQDGVSYRRTYCKSDAQGDVIVFGRVSSSVNPDDLGAINDLSDIGGHVVSRGRSAFVSPVMSRQHARLVFSGDTVYLSDPPGHSHHGTFITRGHDTFRVEHPQPIQNGDRITFGKTVHRAGQSYHPLVAEVQLLRDDPDLNPHSYLSFRSFNGHGYSLPGHFEIPEDDINDLEDDPDVYKDDVEEEVERPETHKFYAVHEPDDDEESMPAPEPTFPGPILPSIQDPSDQFALEPSHGSGPFGSEPPMAPKFQSAQFVIPRPLAWLPAVNHFRGPRLPFSSFQPFRPVDVNLPPPPCASLFMNTLPPVCSNEPSILTSFDSALHEVRQGALPEVHAPKPHSETIDIIDVDAVEERAAKEDEREIFSVDSSSDSGSLSSEDEQDAEGSSDMDQSDDEVVEVHPPKTAVPPAPDVSSDMKRMQNNVADISSQVTELRANHDRSQEMFVLHKFGIKAKLSAMQIEMATLRDRIVERGRAEEDIQKRKEEIMEDMEDRKRVLLSAMDVYDEDLKYDVDRALDDVDDLVADTNDARIKIEDLIQDARKLKDEADAITQAELKAVKEARVQAIAEINDIVIGMKRKRDEAMDEISSTALEHISHHLAIAIPPEPQEDIESVAPPAVTTTEAAVAATPEIVDVAVQASPSKRRRIDLSTFKRRAMQVLIGGAALYYHLGASHTGDLLE